MEKFLAVVAGDKVIDIGVREGTTAADVINDLGLPSEYALSRRDGVPFGAHDIVFDQVSTGEKLFASSPAEVGAATKR